MWAATAAGAGEAWAANGGTVRKAEVLSCPATMRGMATAVKKLDLHVGELVEIEGRRYEVVPDKTGGLTIEPPITPISELYEKRGMKPASAEDFERIAGDLPTDGEG